MKKPIIYLLLNCFFVLNVFSQENLPANKPLNSSLKKHEVNLGFTDLFGLNSKRNYSGLIRLYDIDNDGYLDYYPSYYYSYLSTQYGLGYKYHFGSNAIRIYVEAGINNSQDNRTSTGSNSIENREYSNKSTTYGSRLGYERSLGTKKVNFFYGIDLIYYYSKGKYYSKRNTVYTNPSDTTTNDTSEDYTNSGIGVGPVMGIKIFLSENISLSTETRIETISYKTKSSSTSNSTGGYSPKTTQSESTGERLIMQFAPLGIISINAHF